MSNAIQGLKPELVWKYFAEISAVPRCSKHEQQIARYVLGKAKQLGLAARQDTCGNVVVKKPASPGFAGRAGICLQGHLDMVCEKNAGKVHDFSKDPIELVRRDGAIMANGTTLGADNGVAIATNLAIMDDTSLKHGPLEFLFTVDEETGLTGAQNLAADFIESRTLLNLDSEEEGSIYVGCSGGRDTTATWKIDFEAAPAGSACCTLSVCGLKGGHSGLEIDKGRGNALKIMNRALLALQPLGMRLSSLEGGNKRNAIPREGRAVLFLPERALGGALSRVGSLNAALKAEISVADPDLRLSLVEEDRKRGKVIRKAQQRKILSALAALPHGVLKMSAEIPGLVETSTNVAVVSTTSKAVVLATSQRSSVASELDEAVQTVVSVLTLSGARVQQSDGYPGWKPNLASPILRIAKETYKSLYKKEPSVKAIHAGLECGIIGERIPGMDMISFGPTLEGVHSPDEKIDIASVERFWNFLLAILGTAA